MFAAVVRRARTESDKNHISALYRATLPDTTMPSIDEGDWWLAWDGSKAIGFAGMHPSQVWTKTGYFCAAGVLPSHQGQGLQKRLINVRLSRAAVLGYEWAITYTMKDNYPSINNLLACGFRAYEPRKKWAGIKDVMYWKRKT